MWLLVFTLYATMPNGQVVTSPSYPSIRFATERDCRAEEVSRNAQLQKFYQTEPGRMVKASCQREEQK